MDCKANLRGAIFDFAGYLTTLEEPYTVGAAHDASRMATEIKTWMEKRKIGDGDANVQSWEEAFVPSITGQTDG